MGIQSPDITDERAQLVDRIDARHEQALRLFFSKRPPKYSFYVPNPALSYLIPRRLLELDDIDPESVRLTADRCASSLDIRITTNKDIDTNEDNVTYFTGKLNRQLLHVLPAYEQTRLLGHLCPNQTTTYKQL